MNNKKYFLIWADNGAEINELINTFAAHGHELQYWVGLKENTSQLKNIVFQDHYEAWAGAPASGLEKFLLPPSTELVSQMQATESMALTMMDKKFGDMMLIKCS